MHSSRALASLRPRRKHRNLHAFHNPGYFLRAFFGFFSLLSSLLLESLLEESLELSSLLASFFATLLFLPLFCSVFPFLSFAASLAFLASFFNLLVSSSTFRSSFFSFLSSFFDFFILTFSSPPMLFKLSSKLLAHASFSSSGPFGACGFLLCSAISAIFFWDSSALYTW